MSIGKTRLDQLRKKLAERKVKSVKRRHEYFRITKFRRLYDKQRHKFSIDIAYETAVSESPRSVAIAEAFGLGLDQQQRFIIYDNVNLKISPNDVVLITGDSGSGKSVLLRALRSDVGMEAIDLTEVYVETGKPLIETVGKTVEESIELLSLVGLNDAYLFLRTYDELSDGQKYRYRIAKLIESNRQWWFLDEFCATLDRDTARIVAFNVQKIARDSGKVVILATTHTDLFDDIRPSVHVHKRFGKEISIRYYCSEPARECSLAKEMRIRECTTAEWKKLAPFHYRSHRIVAPRRIFCMKRKKELCGVIVYSYPAPTCLGRRLVLPKMTMKELNEKLSTISRVVIHPKYRAVGLGTKLVKDTLRLSGTEHVEMSAVMAKYSPFAEKAGMRRISVQPPSQEASKIAAILGGLEFNTHLLSSKSYVLSKLQSLDSRRIEEIKQAFIKHRNVRFLKSFSGNLPFGRGEVYKEKITSANLSKLASLIQICGFLLQTKVYLHWRNSLAP